MRYLIILITIISLPAQAVIVFDDNDILNDCPGVIFFKVRSNSGDFGVFVANPGYTPRNIYPTEEDIADGITNGIFWSGIYYPHHGVYRSPEGDDCRVYNCALPQTPNIIYYDCDSMLQPMALTAQETDK